MIGERNFVRLGETVSGKGILARGGEREGVRGGLIQGRGGRILCSAYFPQHYFMLCEYVAVWERERGGNRRGRIWRETE